MPIADCRLNIRAPWDSTTHVLTLPAEFCVASFAGEHRVLCYTTSTHLSIQFRSKSPMARARPGLAKAVTEILESRGTDGKRMSFRQAERMTGLAPATISELAKGNARTPETVRRFAVGVNEDVTRLMLLAGFVPEESVDVSTASRSTVRTPAGSASSDGSNLGPED